MFKRLCTHLQCPRYKDICQLYHCTSGIATGFAPGVHLANLYMDACDKKVVAAFESSALLAPSNGPHQAEPEGSISVLYKAMTRGAKL